MTGETKGSFLYSYKSLSFTYAYAATLGLEPAVVRIVKAHVSRVTAESQGSRSLQDSAPDVWPAKVKITVAIALPRYVDLAQACVQLSYLTPAKGQKSTYCARYWKTTLTNDLKRSWLSTDIVSQRDPYSKVGDELLPRCPQ